MKISNNPAWLIAAMSVLTGCHAPPEAATANPIATVRVSPRDCSFGETLTAYGTVESSPDQIRSVTVQAETQMTENPVIVLHGCRRGQPSKTTARAERDDKARGLKRRFGEAKAAQAEAKRVERLWGSASRATNSSSGGRKSAAASAAALRESLRRGLATASCCARRAPASSTDLPCDPVEVVAAGTVVARIADPAATRVRVGLEPGVCRRGLSRRIP